uniref:Uncharacterized protein n=1 Tax=Meloidogyne incognita TaxID=6306 RepID=A0A914M765_MELIC
MAPTKSRAGWLREWTSRIEGNSVYTTDGKVILCEACQQKTTGSSDSILSIESTQFNRKTQSEC